jgi:hypothetical protein
VRFATGSTLAPAASTSVCGWGWRRLLSLSPLNSDRSGLWHSGNLPSNGGSPEGGHPPLAAQRRFLRVFQLWRIIRMLPGLHWVAGTAGNCRVLRGGSFINNEDNARCADRNRNNPDNRNRNNGVRVGVAAAHSSPEQAARRKCRPATACPEHGRRVCPEQRRRAWRPRHLRESAACPWPQSRACGLVGSGEYRIAPAPGQQMCPWAGALVLAVRPRGVQLRDSGVCGGSPTLNIQDIE